MRILLANDDGFHSPGIVALYDALSASGEHELWIIAPDGERSGMSHYITIKDPIRARKMGERMYEISGSPADCVMTAFLGIMPEKPDMVISGINLGPNLGTDITYSGTVAAARQAVYMGVCGVAVSVNAFEAPWHFEPLARFISGNLQAFLSLHDANHLVNVNGPNSALLDIEAEVTHPCYRAYNDKMTRFVAPRGDEYWFLQGSPIDTSDEEGSDWNAVVRGKISVSPVHIHPLNSTHEHYGNVQFRSPGSI